MILRLGKIVTAPSAVASCPRTGCILAPQLSLARKDNSDDRFFLMTDWSTRLVLSSFTNMTTPFASSSSSSLSTSLSIWASVASRVMISLWAKHIPVKNMTRIHIDTYLYVHFFIDVYINRSFYIMHVCLNDTKTKGGFSVTVLQFYHLSLYGWYSTFPNLENV